MTLTQPTRDVMLVCRNGHVVTDRLRARPDLRHQRCDRCGTETLERCPTCDRELLGAPLLDGPEPVGAWPALAVAAAAGFAAGLVAAADLAAGDCAKAAKGNSVTVSAEAKCCRRRGIVRLRSEK